MGRWTADVTLYSEGNTTRARVTLVSPASAKFVGIGLVDTGKRAVRLPGVADELALVRALADLTEELLEAVASDVESDIIDPPTSTTDS